MAFDITLPERVIFGTGSISKLAEVIQSGGFLGEDGKKRVLVIVGDQADYARPLFQVLDGLGADYLLFRVAVEPTTGLVQQGVDLCRKEKCSLVIGCGGGSVMDTGKAVAGLSTNPGDIYDYLEVVGKGKSLPNPGLPYIAIPTTAGTGTEVTRNAVISAVEFGVKVSLRSSYLIPALSIVDPQFTYNLPPAVTASTGLDALTQLLEAYVSNQANPFTDALCLEGLSRAGRSLRTVYHSPQDTAAREDMSVASLFSGIALAHAKLGIVHGFAGVIGGMFDAPHGAVCACLLAPSMRMNVQALEQRAPQSPSLKRFTLLGQVLTGQPAADAMAGVAWVQETCAQLQIPGLATYGLTRERMPEVVEKSSKASSTKGNPIVLTAEEMEEILQMAL